MSHFKHHVFFCCNQREPGETCCNALGATETQTYAKDRIAQLKMKGEGKVRINKAGCLDEEIIQEHLIHGRVVERLKI